MRVCLKYNKKTLSLKKIKLIEFFLNEINRKFPLRNDLEMFLLDKQMGKMTTGSFSDKKHRIKILCKGRMMSDVLRTISHEWFHAFDKENINFEDRKDIGGDSENFANTLSGAFLKYFVKKNPEVGDEIYK